VLYTPPTERSQYFGECHHVLVEGTDLAERAANDQFEYSVATMPPTLQHRKLAYALVVVTLAAYATVPPFATIQLPRVDGFVLSASSDTHYGGARFEITLPTKIAEPSVPAAATEQSPRCA